MANKSLLRSIINFFRGIRDDAAASLADDVRDGKFAIEDAEVEVRNLKNRLVHLKAETITLRNRLKAAQANVSKYTDIATRAVSKKQDADAREALILKQKAQKEVDTLTAEVTKNQSVVEQIESLVATTTSRVQDAKSNINRLEARNAAAEIRKELVAAANGLASSSGLAGLTSLEQSVQLKEAEAEALEEMNTVVNPSAALEARYSAEGDSSIDDELAKLKASVVS